MANLPTCVLRTLVRRGHALLLSDLQQAFPAHKQPGALARAVESLKRARCVIWTTQGWLATDAGRNYLRANAKLSFGGAA